MHTRTIKVTYNLNKTLETEQCPADLWCKHQDKWTTILPGPAKIQTKQQGNTITIKILKGKPKIDPTEYLTKYFHPIDTQYIQQHIKSTKIRDLAIIQDIHPEYRILEAILTQNTTIKRIKQMQKCILQATNTPNPHTYLPTHKEILKNKHKIQKCKLGYRYKYLIKTAQKLQQNPTLPQELKEMETQQAWKKLQQLPGIGPKTADLILLYAYHKTDTYPIDTIVIKATRKHFPETKHLPPLKIRELMIKQHQQHAAEINLALFYLEKKTYTNICIWPNSTTSHHPTLTNYM